MFFSDSELEGGSESTRLKTVYKQWYTAYHDNIKSWWEVQSLEKYIKSRIVPKGLRISITPATRSRSTTLLNSWKKELTDSSIRPMHILLEEEKKILETSSKRLKELIDQTLKSKSNRNLLDMNSYYKII